jgi:riboflavin kinase/FMN adenylyltransferase
MEVIRAEAYQLDGAHVSSSVVRTLLGKGDVAMASHCMGYDYSLEGEVIGGQQIGRTLGFPTANLQMVDPLKIVPADGVYAVHVQVDGHTYKGMLNIGCRPTIDDDTRRTIEVHLFHFEGNLYGKTLTVSLVARLRDELKFESREDLQQQIHADVSMAKRILAAQ